MKRSRKEFLEDSGDPGGLFLDAVFYNFIDLEKIHNAFTAWLERTTQLGEFMNSEDLLIHRLDLLNLSNNEIYTKEREVFDSLTDNDNDLRELLTNLFYERLTI